MNPILIFRYVVAAGRPSLTGTLIARLSADQMTHWTACNKGCFVLLKLAKPVTIHSS